MRVEWLSGSVAFLVVVTVPATALATSPLPPYPAAERSGHVDTYFGTPVPDPYRWLEDPGDPRTTAWVDAEATLTRSYLDTLPTRSDRTAQMTALLSQPSVASPKRIGGRLFWLANDGQQAQSVLHTSTRSIARGRVLLDPNRLSTDGTLSLSQWVPSPDGRFVAWATSDGGSDWNTWRVRRVSTGKDLPDVLQWSKFSSVAWAADSRSFFYGRYPKPADPLESANRDMAVYRHALGRPQKDDTEIYSDPRQPQALVAPVAPPGFARIWIDKALDTSTNALAYLDGRNRIRPLRFPGEGYSSVVAQSRHHAWIQTTVGAENGRIVRIDLRRPHPAHWLEVVPTGPSTMSADGASMIGDRLVVAYLKDAASLIRTFTLTGVPKGRIVLPGFGTVSDVTDGPRRGHAFISYASFTQPTMILDVDARTRQSRVWYSPKTAFDPADFVTEQVWTTSRDGTRIPAFVTRRRDITPTGANPTWLFGYGGFDISLTPQYSPDAIAWMQNGGVYVVATLRGGGEYGRAWHRAGTKTHKQNVFDDFIGVAEWLVANRWTSPRHLAANGRSNGGLLAGAMLTQRPDLFGAVIPEVGVLDMLRYQDFTIGYAWADDYGRSDDSAEMFAYLRGYSPLHNVRPGQSYPATLIMTAERDDRVVPAHSYKFAATLQHADPTGNPLLIRIQRRAGHGAGASLRQRIEASADRLAFLDAHTD